MENGLSKYDSCNMYDIDYDYLAKVGNISIYKTDRNITELAIKPCDNGWAYDRSYNSESAVTSVRILFIIILNSLFFNF